MKNHFELKLEQILDSRSQMHKKNVERLVRYFGHKSKSSYDGAQFETYENSVKNTNHLVAADFVAVTFLSMEIRRSSRSGITPNQIQRITEQNQKISRLLKRIPDNEELHSLSNRRFDQIMGDYSPSHELWKMLRDKETLALPRIATFKLLARKRPLLFPIADSYVEHALGRQTNWWKSWHATLSTREDLVGELKKLRTNSSKLVNEIKNLSLIRVADIVIWDSQRNP